MLRSFYSILYEFWLRHFGVQRAKAKDCVEPVLEQHGGHVNDCDSVSAWLCTQDNCWYSEERWNYRCWRLQHVPKTIQCAGISLFPLVLYGTDFLWLGKGWMDIHGLLGNGWHRVLLLLLHIHAWEVPGLGFVITDHPGFSLLSCILRLAKLFWCLLQYTSLSGLNLQGEMSLVQFLSMEI